MFCILLKCTGGSVSNDLVENLNLMQQALFSMEHICWNLKQLIYSENEPSRVSICIRNHPRLNSSSASFFVGIYYNFQAGLVLRSPIFRESRGTRCFFRPYSVPTRSSFTSKKVPLQNGNLYLYRYLSNHVYIIQYVHCTSCCPCLSRVPDLSSFNFDLCIGR